MTNLRLGVEPPPATRRARPIVRATIATAACALLLILAPASASADFGIASWDGEWTAVNGAIQAGGHPDTIVTRFTINTVDPGDGFGNRPDGSVQDVAGEVVPGLVPNPNAIPKCPGVQALLEEVCPVASQVGFITLTISGPNGVMTVPRVPVYNMEALPGVPGSVAFNFADNPVYLSGTIRSDGDYGLTVSSTNISQVLAISGVELAFWGVPADPIHDVDRVVSESCILPGFFCSYGASAGIAPEAFLTNPTACTEPGQGLPMTLKALSWQQPPQTDEAFFATHVFNDPLTPLGTTGCDLVPFDPEFAVQATTDQAESPTGIEANLRFPQQGLTNPDGLAQSHLRKATVTLPEGVTINPSYADGVEVCTPEQIGLTSSSPIRFNLAPAKCPDASQIGSVEIESPPLDTPVKGALYVAQQDDPYAAGAENPFNSLFALYIVAEGSGVSVKLAGEVSLNSRTGQIVTTFDENPQLPFSRFTLKFKGGQRAPIATPSSCGTFKTVGEFSPWSRPDVDIAVSSPLQITRGANNGPCINDPAARPFAPTIDAGTLNPNAGAYSPFVLRMSRRDGEQEITGFSADLPPGLSGKLAGVTKCSDAALASAEAQTGAAEKANPSCPSSSRVGSALTGTGTGQLLTYVPGVIYLAGPYRGARLSVATVVPAQVGPFDVGTIVVRSALRIDSDDAQVHVDPVPIPYIRQGVALHVRDIRVILDRPDFTLNPTSCDPMSIAAQMTGTGGDFASAADDSVAHLSERFQAANCASLDFKPGLSFKLKGSTRRGGNPAFTATLKPRPGDANIGGASVTLPPSEFLDNRHIGTVCTRVQYTARQCPAGSEIGFAKASSPLIDKPLEGPVFLRSSSNELPDLVASLDGEFHIDLVGTIDSVKKNPNSEISRIRNRFVLVPDAPVDQFTLSLQGGKKGLLQNSRNLCSKASRATVKFIGQNGKVSNSTPLVKPPCAKKPKRFNQHKRD